MGSTIRSVQEAPPAHYSIKIKSFSSFLSNHIDKYESGLFDVGGYKWRLYLHPNGRTPSTNHISLYLAIAETESLPKGWEVSVKIKMFVYNNNEDEYLTIEGANDKLWRFRDTKTEWGFTQLLPLDTFKDDSNGYLVNDSCEFGVEVFIVNKIHLKGECISLNENPTTTTFPGREWPRESLSKEAELLSGKYSHGGYNWVISVFPRGKGSARNNYFSLYMKLVDTEKLPLGRKVYAEFKMAAWNDSDEQKKKQGYTYKEGVGFFSASSDCHGFEDFFPLSQLESFIYRDNKLHVHAVINTISQVKDLSLS